MQQHQTVIERQTHERRNDERLRKEDHRAGVYRSEGESEVQRKLKRLRNERRNRQLVLYGRSSRNVLLAAQKTISAINKKARSKKSGFLFYGYNKIRHNEYDDCTA